MNSFKTTDAEAALVRIPKCVYPPLHFRSTLVFHLLQVTIKSVFCCCQKKKSLLLQCSRIFSSKREQFAPEVWEHGWLLPPAVISIIQGTVMHNVYTSVNKNLSTRLMIPRPCFFSRTKD